MRTLPFLAFVALLCASAPLAACGSADAPSPEQGASSEEGVTSSKKPANRAPACLAANAQCETTSDACCAGTRCVEYTVYDWPRCRKPAPAGSYCSSSAECASDNCVDGVCSGNACLALGAQCDVGGAGDACCPGTVCEEYTVYDWPRCRVPKR